MSALIKKAVEFLTADGMPVTYDGTSPSLQMALDIQGTQYPMVIRAMDDTQLMAIYTYLPTPIPDDQMAEVALFVATVNQGLFIGNLEIDTSQNLVRTRQSFVLEGNPLTHELFKECFQISFTTMHNLNGAVQSVFAGSGGLETVKEFWGLMENPPS